MTYKTPAMTDADTFNAEIAANAVRYAASLFLGRGEFANAEETTLDDIKIAADFLKEQNPACVRDVVIYAFDAHDNKTLISGTPYKGRLKLAPAADSNVIADVVAHEGEAAIPAFLRKGLIAAEPAPAKPAKLETLMAISADMAKPAKAPKAPKAKAEKPAKAPKAPKAEKPAKAAKGPSKWDTAREMLLREGGIGKDELFAALKWRSMSIPLLLANTKLSAVEKTDGGWAGKA